MVAEEPNQPAVHTGVTPAEAERAYRTRGLALISQRWQPGPTTAAAAHALGLVLLAQIVESRVMDDER